MFHELAVVIRYCCDVAVTNRNSNAQFIVCYVDGIAWNMKQLGLFHTDANIHNRYPL